MNTRTFNLHEIFCSEDKRFFPEKLEAKVDLRNIPDAEIDVVICAHNYPELTNQTIRNYEFFERKAKIHFIVVESSGDPAVFEKIVGGANVSRVLLTTNIHITGRVHGYGSYGMGLSATIGSLLGRAPLIFYSHSDMLAYGENFLTFLKSKLTGGVRLASFSQRHIIPFTGSMLMTRALFEEPGLDWLPIDRNEYILGTGLEPLGAMVDNLTGVDCGEQYVFSEIRKGNPVYVCASRGGSRDWWHDPVDYYATPKEVIHETLDRAKASIQYAPLTVDPNEFQKTYSTVLKAGRERWWLLEKPKWWRYTFDEAGKLIFIHHGRGTTQRAVKRWLQFGAQARERLSQSQIL